MKSYEQCGQGQSYCSLCTLDTIHKLFFVTRFIINKINKVQWVVHHRWIVNVGNCVRGKRGDNFKYSNHIKHRMGQQTFNEINKH
jgi:hypothetical protein